MIRPHHFGVTVTDLDRAVEFYRDTFGLDSVERFAVSGAAFAAGVGVEGATGRFAHFVLDGARIELVEYDPAGPAASESDVNQPGATHLGLAVDDLDAFYADLDPGVETISEPRTTESGTRILFVRDPDGTLIEVLEP
ncbi:VOC family protein [Haloplanus rubicundus]|uniref:VOC family protein n=1 Tax=Haloplanus rubicundus TaxID=1547898 RepID=A0A345EFE6_9EURY|nr:VOC family protein [Haloplanus rubicundus]AXG07503.1 VOC family protein [Haloplanus rubicundus]AXG10918.1 VOC family protein [Haloplanus rubicundus]